MGRVGMMAAMTDNLDERHRAGRATGDYPAGSDGAGGLPGAGASADLSDDGDQAGHAGTGDQAGHTGSGDPAGHAGTGDSVRHAGSGDRDGPLGTGDPDGLSEAGRHAVEAFVAHLRDERGLSGHTVVAYRRDLIQFLQFAGRAGVNDPARVEPLLLRRFLALQRTRGLAAASIARKAAALRAGFPAGPSACPSSSSRARSTGCSPGPSRSTRSVCATGRSSSSCTRPASGSGSCVASAWATST
jgi:hypothetical protein